MRALLEAAESAKPADWPALDRASVLPANDYGGGISMHDLAGALRGALGEAVTAARSGHCVLVDVRVRPVE